jgi:hypothetical protein
MPLRWAGAMIHISNFIKTGSGLQNSMGGNIQTHRQGGDRTSILLFFQNKGHRLKSQDEWGRRGLHRGYWWERQKERDH